MFAMFPLILTFYINPILDYIWSGDKVRKIFRGLLIHTNNFCFLNIALFLLYLLFTFFSTDGGTDKPTYRSSDPELKKCLIVVPSSG